MDNQDIIYPQTLSQFFGAAIAKLDNIEESQITPNYIEQQREKKIYPFTVSEEGSALGGHCEIGLKFYTRNQLARISEIVDKAMSNI